MFFSSREIRPITQLLIALRAYALGSFQLAVGDFAGVSQPSVCRIFRKVSVALTSKANEVIRMPQNGLEMLETSRDFYRKAKFPRTIGAVDCTHIPIRSRGGDFAENYRNRKGWFSLNVQVVASAKLKISSVVTQWPGATHDQHIFKNSKLKRRFEQGEFRDFILVGDSGYKNTKYLATPYLETGGDPVRELYNQSQIRTRVCVERTFGVIKRRFPVLSMGMQNKNLDTIRYAITACCVLHNIATDERDALPEVHIDGFAEMFEASQMETRPYPERGHDAGTVRSQLVCNYFPMLMGNAPTNENENV